MRNEIYLCWRLAFVFVFLVVVGGCAGDSKIAEIASLPPEKVTHASIVIQRSSPSIRLDTQEEISRLLGALKSAKRGGVVEPVRSTFCDLEIHTKELRYKLQLSPMFGSDRSATIGNQYSEIWVSDGTNLRKISTAGIVDAISEKLGEKKRGRD